MQDFTIPKNIQPELQDVFQKIRRILRNTQVPMLRDIQSVRSIPEGSRAYLVTDSGVQHFVKHNGRLYVEELKEYN